MPNLSTYQPPGVYVDDVSQGINDPITLGVAENLLCIVAPAQGFSTASETVRLSSTTDATLQNAGVVQDASLVLTTMAGGALVQGTDYVVATSVTASGDVLTTLKRLPVETETVSPGGVAEGDLVNVAYHFVDASYYSPQTFTDYSVLAKMYGQPMSDVVGDLNPINSPLTLAAKVAFENGAGSIIAVPVSHATDGVWRDEFKAAYDKVLTDHRVSVIAVVWPDAEVDTGSKLSNYTLDIKQHCDTAAANGYGRSALVSGAPNFDDTSFPFENVAEAIADKRVVAVYPTHYLMTNPATSAQVDVSGGYMAAALGGRLVYNPVQQSLTRQTMASFNDVPASIKQKMTLAFKNNLSANGVLVIEPDRSNRLVCRHGVTTDITSLMTREISLVRVADVLLQSIQVGLDNSGLIGGAIDDTMVTTVQGTLTGLLEEAISDQVIVSYANVVVRQLTLPSGDPSVIDCTFVYKPAVPLNYITVSFSLDLTTGAIVTDTDEALTENFAE